MSSSSLAVDETGEETNVVHLAPCNGSVQEQRWRWTPDNQLLNVGSFMCLSGIGATVKLQSCRVESTTQHWRCAERFIVQPSTGSCLTSDATSPLNVSTFEDALEQALTGEKPPTATLQPCSAKRDDQKWEARVDASERKHVGICSTSPKHSVVPCETQRFRSDAMGWVTCNSLGYYVKGLQRTSADNKENLSGIQCCSTSHVFTGKVEGPAAAISAEECHLLDTHGNDRSFECPPGMFLKGFYFLGTNLGAKSVKCCRPDASTQFRYTHCFAGSLDYSKTADESLTCQLPGYSITSMGTTKCDQNYRCASQVKCCY